MFGSWRRFYAAHGAAFMLAALSAQGACAEGLPVLAKEIVVSANRIETESEKLGSAVSVITAADIERLQIRTIADALRLVPGLSVSSVGGKGQSTSVRIRGAEAYHTKILIDGVDVVDPALGQPAYNFANLLATDIDRIEIVRGPQSLLYGAEAIGGVINVITKKGQGAPKADLLLETGSLHTHTGRAGISGSHGKIDYALTASHFETDGISAAEMRNGNRERDPYWNNTFSTRLGARLTENWGVEASGRAMKSKVDYDDWTGFGASGRAIDDSDTLHQDEKSARLATDVTVLDGKLKNIFGYSLARTDRKTENGTIFFGARSNSYDGDMDKLDYQGNLSIASGHVVVFGAEHKNESTRQSTIATDVSNNGYFLDYQLNPVDPLFITVGGRLDDHQSFGTHDTYRTTAAYLVDQTHTRLHGSYGTGFRAPSLFELFHPIYGNRALQPEESRGWDFGIEQRLLKDKAVIDLTWFDNRIQDLIQFGNSGYVNIASTRAQGLEGAAHWDVTEQWRLNAGYTYTESRNVATGRILARRPKHQGSMGVTWMPIEHLSADAVVRAVGSQYDSATGRTLGGFALVNLAVSYDVNDWMRIFGRLENIADKKYQEVDTYGMSGRVGFLGVNATF